MAARFGGHMIASKASLTVSAVIGVPLLMWASSAIQDSLRAQNKAPAVMKRIYTGTDGLSHVEDIPVDAKLTMEKVSSVEVRVSKPGNFSDWHVGPQRQYII